MQVVFYVLDCGNANRDVVEFLSAHGRALTFLTQGRKISENHILKLSSLELFSCILNACFARSSFFSVRSRTYFPWS